MPGSNPAQPAEDEYAHLSTRSTWGPCRAPHPKHTSPTRGCPKNPVIEVQMQTVLEMQKTWQQAQAPHTMGMNTTTNASNTAHIAPPPESTHLADFHSLLPSFLLSFRPLPLRPFFPSPSTPLLPSSYFLHSCFYPEWLGREHELPTRDTTDLNTLHPARALCEHPEQTDMHATHKPATRVRFMTHMHHRAPRPRPKSALYALYCGLYATCWLMNAEHRMLDTHMPKLTGCCRLRTARWMPHTVGCAPKCTCTSTLCDACCKLGQHAVSSSLCKILLRLTPKRPATEIIERRGRRLNARKIYSRETPCLPPLATKNITLSTNARFNDHSPPPPPPP